MLRTSQLQAIVALSDTGAIRAASRQLGISQSALSRTLRELEVRLEEPLFLRHSYGTELTEVGKTLVGHARIALDAIERATDETRRLSRHGPMSARIALSPALAVLGFEHIVDVFTRRYPDGKLDVSSGVLSNVLLQLIEGKLDVAFSLADEREMPHDIQFEQLGFAQMVPVTHMNSGIPLDTTWTELTRKRWAINSNSRSADAGVINWLAQRGIMISDPAINCSSPYLLSMLARTSDVITFCPRQSLRTAFLADLREIRVPELPPPFPIAALYPRRRLVTEATRLLIDTVQKIVLKQPHEST